MTIETIMTVVTAFVSYIFGLITKKFNLVESKYIPVQNFIIGIIVALIYYFFVDNSNIANAVIMAFSGLMAGGTYDLFKVKED